MLFIDTYQDPQGNIKTQYVPNTPKDIKPLRDCLRLIEVQNPLCLFANRQKSGFYDNLPEEKIQRDLWVADTLSAFWKKADDDPGQPQMNAFAVLARMTDTFLAEHEELLDLRDKVQQLSSRRKKTRSSRKKTDDDLPDVFTAAPSFEDEDENLEFIDFLSYGVGLQAQRYSEFLNKHKKTDNSLSIGNGDYYDISDYGVITYADSGEFRQAVNLYFHDTDKPSEYTVTVTVDTIADDELSNVQDMFEYLLNHKMISIPYSDLKNIELEIAGIESPCHVLSGIKLSYDLSITVPEDGIDEVQMQKIYSLTGTIQKHVHNAIRKTK